MAYDFSEPKLPPVSEPAPRISPIIIHTPAPAKPVPPPGMAKDKFVPATVIKPPAMPVKPIEAPVENSHKAK
jgi:hypothetical protein